MKESNLLEKIIAVTMVTIMVVIVTWTIVGIILIFN